MCGYEVRDIGIFRAVVLFLRLVDRALKVAFGPYTSHVDLVRIPVRRHMCVLMVVCSGLRLAGFAAVGGYGLTRTRRVLLLASIAPLDAVEPLVL